MTRLAVLAYHKVGDPPAGGWETWFYVPEKVFSAQLAALRDGGWKPLNAATFVRALDEPGILPERAVLVTFDDGYRSVLKIALPWLERFAFPAVLFMPSDLVGQTNRFDLDSEPEEPLCDWDDLRELTNADVAVQSHAASHAAFSTLSPPQRRDEIERSKTALETRLKQTVDLLAYPYGDDAGAPPDLRDELAAAGYRAAFLYGGGAFSLAGLDPYRVQRIAIGPDTDIASVLDSNGGG